VRLLFICLAGAIGTGLRYVLGGVALRAFPPDFPYGTLGINVAGSFSIGVVQVVALGNAGFPETLRAAIVVGLLGGFTTYSAFSYETLDLAGRGAWTAAGLYVLFTTTICLAACAAGMGLGRALTGPR
jgi:fluoride exporter